MESINKDIAKLKEREQTLHTLIDNFFSHASISDYQRTLNETLNAYLDIATSGEHDYHPKSIKGVVYFSNFQSQFIAELKEQWENYKKYY